MIFSCVMEQRVAGVMIQAILLYNFNHHFRFWYLFSHSAVFSQYIWLNKLKNLVRDFEALIVPYYSGQKVPHRSADVFVNLATLRISPSDHKSPARSNDNSCGITDYYYFGSEPPYCSGNVCVCMPLCCPCNNVPLFCRSFPDVNDPVG